MPDPNDGAALDFRRLFRVHRIFGAVAAGLRPGMILLGMFLVLVLDLGGRTWDGIRGRNIESGGLLAAPQTDGDRMDARLKMARSVQELIPRQVRPEGFKGEDPVEIRAELVKLQKAETDLQASARLSRAIAEMESITPKGTYESFSRTVTQILDGMAASIVSVQPLVTADLVKVLVFNLPRAAWQHDRSFVIFYGAFAILVLSVGGGAMARMTASGIAGRAIPSPSDAMAFALARWPSFFFAVTLPLLFVGGLFILGGIAGVIMKVPLLNVIGGLLYGAALFFGFLAAFVGIMWAVSLPLSTPAGACDGADHVEANQRAVAFVLKRPVLALGYLIAGVIAWSLGMYVVDLFATATLNLTAASSDWLAKAPAMTHAGGFQLLQSERVPPPAAYGGTSGAAAGLIDFWQSVVKLIVAGATLSMFWSISTAGYLCMRHACDEQPMEDLWDPREAEGIRAETE